MIELDAAIELVKKYLHQASERPMGEITVFSDSFVEKPYGWIFDYESSEYLRTGDRRLRLIGRRAVLVKRNGDIVFLSAGLEMEDAIAKYEAQNEITNHAERR